MTSASEIQPPLGLGSGIEALRAKRGWIIALGIIYVIAGLIALFGGPRSLDRNWADYKRESRRLSFPGYAARSLLLDAITFLS